MNIKTAEQLLPCFRPGRPLDPRVEKAARVAEADARLRSQLEAQTTWDAQLAGVIHSIEPPEDLRRKLTSYGPGPVAGRGRLRSQLTQPGMMAVWLGILVLIGLVVFVSLDRRENFEGRERVERLLGVTRNMSGVELQPVDMKAGLLGDWFYMRGFERFAVPPEVETLTAVGSRVFRHSGHAVAQMAVDERNSLVYVFRATDFGVDLPDGGDWRLLDDEGWVAAIRRQGETCTMITFRGSRSEMRDFLRSLSAK